MSRIARLAVLAAALLSLFVVGASTAGAVTWHNSGNTAYTSTAGPVTLSSTSAGLNCTGSTSTGTVGATPFVGATWTAVTGTTTFSGCSLSGISTNVHCAFTFAAQAQPTADTVTGEWHWLCSIYQFLQKVCHVAGKVFGFIKRAVKALFGHNTGGSLVLTNGTAGTCPLGNGDVGHLSAMTSTVTTASGGTGTSGPVITRTA